MHATPALLHRILLTQALAQAPVMPQLAIHEPASLEIPQCVPPRLDPSPLDFMGGFALSGLWAALRRRPQLAIRPTTKADATSELPRQHVETPTSPAVTDILTLLQTHPNTGVLPTAIQEIKLGKKLGLGGTSKVCACTLVLIDGSSVPCAVKIFRSGPNCGNTAFKNEDYYLRHLSDPALPKWYGSIHLMEGRPTIMMELVSGNSLSFYRDHQSCSLPFRVVLESIAQTAEALDRLYNAVDNQGNPWRFIHGDIKLNNLLLTAQGMKIIDLDASQSDLRPWDEQDSKSRGTLGYIAPEMEVSGKSHATDIYALGITLYALLVGLPDSSMQQTLKRRDQFCCLEDTLYSALAATTQTVSDNALKQTANCLYNMLRNNPQNRWTAAQVAQQLRHIIEQTEGPTIKEFLTS